MTIGLINANPVVHARRERHVRTPNTVNLPAAAAAAADHHHLLLLQQSSSSSSPSAVDALDIYDSVKDIRDPEHPYSLEQLSVLSEESVSVDDNLRHIRITFTPTVQHCSMVAVIGLCLRVKLMRCFPPHYKVEVNVAAGSHANEDSVNKQLNDKERVAAALENPNLRQLVDECLHSSELSSY